MTRGTPAELPADPFPEGGPTRLVVVAAHPDDESAAVGGLTALAARAGLEVQLVLATDGEGSHPRAPASSAGRLLAPSAAVVRLGVPGGQVAEHADAVVTALVDLIGEQGDETVLLAPRRHDGHADHHAAGLAAGLAARRTDATLWEYPVGLWPRPQPDGVGRRLELPPDDSLERLHETSADPWRVRTSWYEQRKRAVTMAALPHQRYRRALEVGGSVGALAGDLAGRSDELVVVDESGAATATARTALADVDGVTVLQHSVPEQWPDGVFDLVVVSEVGYFLSPQRLRRLIDLVEESLDDDGAVLLCHWQHAVRGWPLDGPRVHEIWRERSSRPVVATHVEADFRLDVLSRTAIHRAEPS